jgi:hypothetical protein
MGVVTPHGVKYSYEIPDPKTRRFQELNGIRAMRNVHRSD